MGRRVSFGLDRFPYNKEQEQSKRNDCGEGVAEGVKMYALLIPRLFDDVAHRTSPARPQLLERVV